MNERNLQYLAYLPILFALMGGLYFGLFSCGGYIWHRYVFYLIFSLSLIPIFFVRLSYLNKAYKKALFIGSTMLIFLVVRAAASTFYPAAPNDIYEFLTSFIRGLQYGPC